MAKRKRLSPAQSDYITSPTPASEPKSIGLGPAPIAQVAGAAAASAALEEVAGEMARARAEGRLIQALDIDLIDDAYLVRDRLVAEDDDLQALIASIRARGQQTPVEVVALDGGRFGLISGWRRLTALRRLRAETGEERFGTARALLRRPETAADAYVAMVEENEIRVGLSFYERARVAAKAVEQGVFETEKAALLGLYASASRAKRSKIRSFLALYHAADDLLAFPSAISERQGLALAKVAEADPEALRRALRAARPQSMEAEQATLQKVLDRAGGPAAAKASAPGPKRRGSRGLPRTEVRDGIFMACNGAEVVLTGPGVTDAFQARLRDWLGRSDN